MIQYLFWDSYRVVDETQFTSELSAAMDRRPPRDATRGTRSAMTSVEIIEEARQELRPVYTKRPETPQEEARRALRDLFSRNPSSHR